MTGVQEPEAAINIPSSNATQRAMESYESPARSELREGPGVQRLQQPSQGGSRGAHGVGGARSQGRGSGVTWGSVTTLHCDALN